MGYYLLIVPIFRFFVLFFLLIGASQLSNTEFKLGRLLLASVIGACYALVCMLCPFKNLWSELLNYLVIVLVGVVAFGIGFHRWRTYIFLYFILDAIIRSGNDLISVMTGVIGVCGIVYYRMYKCGEFIIPVTICYQDKNISFHALHDTGNMLIDPVTGEHVLIVSSKIAEDLMGLKIDQLKDPVNSLGLIPGLRLIPYHTVGKATDFMLGIRINEVKIGRQKTSTVVAFAPEGLELTDRYQALAGGNL